MEAGFRYIHPRDAVVAQRYTAYQPQAMSFERIVVTLPPGGRLRHREMQLVPLLLICDFAHSLSCFICALVYIFKCKNLSV